MRRRGKSVAEMQLALMRERPVREPEEITPDDLPATLSERRADFVIIDDIVIEDGRRPSKRKRRRKC